MTEGWNDKLGAFVQYEGGDVLDASLVFMPLVGFIVPNDPRWQSTMSAMDATLVADSLVYRYDPERVTGRSPRVGGHLLAVHLPLRRCARPLGSARRGAADPLEDADLRQPRRPLLGGDRPHRQQVGNFPQAFTHLALISAVVQLDSELDNPKHWCSTVGVNGRVAASLPLLSQETGVPRSLDRRRSGFDAEFAVGAPQVGLERVH